MEHTYGSSKHSAAAPTVGDLIVDRSGWRMGYIRELHVDIYDDAVTVLIALTLVGTPSVLVPREMLAPTDEPHLFRLGFDDEAQRNVPNGSVPRELVNA